MNKGFMHAQRGNLVVLDLDGTLIDSAPGIIEGLRLALESVDEAAVSEETMRSWIGPPVADTLQRELGHRGETVVTRANRAFRDYFDEEGCWRTSLYIGVAEALEEMLADMDATLVVVTHKPERLAESALVNHGLDRLIGGLYAPAGPGEPIPKESLMERALVSAKPLRVVAAGDRGGDVRAAAAHGVATVGVLWGYGSVGELHAAGAAALASRVSELPQLLAANARTVA